MRRCSIRLVACLAVGWMGGPGCADLTAPVSDTTQSDAGVEPEPQWLQVETPVADQDDIRDIFGTRISNVWAVGERGVILHFDGLEWAMHHSPAEYDLNAVWAGSDDNAWAVGEFGSVVEYDGEFWFRHQLDVPVALRAIWGNAPDDVWVVGDEGTVMHYDGREWAVDKAPTGLPLLGVWGTSRTDMFVVGVGDVFHYDGKGWSRVHSSGITSFVSVWGTGRDNVWILGDRGAAHRYDGQHWTSIEIRPALPDAPELLKASDTARIWGSAPTDVWAIGRAPASPAVAAEDEEGRAAVLHFDGERWTIETTLEVGQQLFDIWSSGPNDIWAVGSDGLFLRRFSPPTI